MSRFFLSGPKCFILYLALDWRLLHYQGALFRKLLGNMEKKQTLLAEIVTLKALLNSIEANLQIYHPSNGRCWVPNIPSTQTVGHSFSSIDLTEKKIQFERALKRISEIVAQFIAWSTVTDPGTIKKVLGTTKVRPSATRISWQDQMVESEKETYRLLSESIDKCRVLGTRYLEKRSIQPTNRPVGRTGFYLSSVRFQTQRKGFNWLRLRFLA